MPQSESKWLRDIMVDLVGATIYEVTEPDEDEFFDICVRTRGGTRFALTPSRDSEGNGPGFMFITEVKANEDNATTG